MLSGLAPDTPLGRIVSIRSEKDKDVIKHFTKEQKRVYDDWRLKCLASMTQQTYEQEMDNFERMFAEMCGGENH